MTRFSPSAFLEPYPKPPCVPSYPALLLPTCPFISPANTTISFWGIQLTSLTVPFYPNNTVRPFLCYEYSYTIGLCLISHQKQLILFAYSTKEPAITPQSSFLDTQNVHLPLRQCLHKLTQSTCQWVHVPGTDPKGPAVPQLITPVRVVINSTRLCCVPAGFPHLLFGI